MLGCAVILFAIGSSAWAQQGSRPASRRRRSSCGHRSFSEGWSARRLWTTTGVASLAGRRVDPNLELRFYGPSGKDLQLVAETAGDVTPLNLWAGMAATPSAAALRDKNNFVDLSVGLAKIRWVVRTSGFHQARPILKLADGTWLVGDRASGTDADFNESEMSISEIRWLKLDMDRVVAVGAWIEHPNLGKVDEVGFADLMPGSGHGAGGYLNVGRIEVYGKPVKR